MARDPETIAHQEWLGFVQPVGLVVSIPALLAAEAYLTQNVSPLQQKFLSCLKHNNLGDTVGEIENFAEFATHVLEWEKADIVQLPQDISASEFVNLEIPLPEYGETLRPTYAVPEFKPKDGRSLWLLLIKELPNDSKLDESSDDRNNLWSASPQAKFERLLRETEIPIGLLVNGKQLRLVYAPRGESSGYITFNFSDMMQVPGRPILAALFMLLSNDRLFRMTENLRLPAILAESRKHQNSVSTKLSEQVLAALYELVSGFQAANEHTGSLLLKEILETNPNHVYSGLLNVLMRLVFILYAEDRNLLSNSPIYSGHYSISGLFERLREDIGLYPDTIEHRYGAWAQLITLFRLIFDGGSHGDFKIPARKGHLFDPDRYPFLEGRFKSKDKQASDLTVPLVSDSIVYRVLSNLLILDGERLSYRTLDVEQIGSVYEAVMGFTMEIAQGPSLAIKPAKAYGAPATINLEELLATKPTERLKWLKEKTDQELIGAPANSLRQAKNITELVLALEKKIAHQVTPQVVPKGSITLQPSDERRRSGSHYTPRSLTEYIVRTTLEPVLKLLPTQPTPDQILELKICDPAMGSGAFLVEACRQLGDELVRSWQLTDSTPSIPADEDELLHARRLVAQRCLYGVDKNPMAVDLAKLSLWLATLAKDHPFTFLDHTLRCGDSLLGLTREEIIRFHWQPMAQRAIDETRIKRCIERATRYRTEILETAEVTLYPILQVKLREADKILDVVRDIGDSVISAFFSSENDNERQAKRLEMLATVSNLLDKTNAQAGPVGRLNEKLIENSLNVLSETPITKGNMPFHWDIEFPEVFFRKNSGFDAIIGNPPFIGGRRTSTVLGEAYSAWLSTTYTDSSNNSDLVGFFFRKAFNLLRANGAFGLIATNTIAQGDTRQTGLRWICKNGGTIFAARKRLKWPGQAAVTVSIIYVLKGNNLRECNLDGKPANSISAYLVQGNNHDNPNEMLENKGIVYQGMIPLGPGFTFDDTDTSGLASSLADMNQLIQMDPTYQERIFPYIGGEELLDSPTHAFHRYVIDFNDMSFEEASRWPNLIQLLLTKVKPSRDLQKRKALRERWWQFAERRPALRTATRELNRILVHPFVATHLAFVFMPTSVIIAGPQQVFSLSGFAQFCVLQSRVHEIWARFFGSSMEDRLRYASSDCFETFPLPPGFYEDPELERCGQEYYEFRSSIMVRNKQGLTATYNRFHDPLEMSAEIKELRLLHEKMDRLVLDSYGWKDLKITTEFLLDYENSGDDEEKSKKKKPWRYRWSESLKEEILARLLALNNARATEELLLKPATRSSSSSSLKKTKKRTNEVTRDTYKIASPLLVDNLDEKQLSLLDMDLNNK